MTKKPPMRLSDLKGGTPPASPSTYSKASPKMTRLKPGKTLTAEEKAAFLAGRPDLQK